jgi:hypothetical protein
MDGQVTDPSAKKRQIATDLAIDSAEIKRARIEVQ